MGCTETFCAAASARRIVKRLFFIPTRYGHVSAMLAAPDAKKGLESKGLTLIMAHGIGPDNSMVEVNRTFLRLAERVAKTGCSSLLFAFPGTAESDGLFSDMSAQQRVLALRDVIDWFISSDLGRYAVLGFSMGGAAAICALDHVFSVPPEFLITVNAVPSFEEADRSYHQWHAKSPEAHLVVGLGEKFFRLKPKRTIADSYARLKLPKLHIQAGKDIKYFAKEFRQIFDRDDGLNQKQWVDVPESDHCFMKVEHHEALLAAVVKWLKKKV